MYDTTPSKGFKKEMRKVMARDLTPEERKLRASVRRQEREEQKRENEQQQGAA